MVGDVNKPNPKLTLLPLIALIFYEVFDGPFGIEDSVRSGGGRLLSLLGFLIFPIIWSLPEALVTVELATSFPKNGGFVVWISSAFGPFWGFQEGIWKWAYACEILRDEYHALGLSAVSTAWGAGLIVGPALGGFLAQPADKYPHIFSKDSIFGRFPYLLACLAISFLAVPSFIAALLAPESLHKHGKQFVSSDESYEVLETGSSHSNPKDHGSTSKETDASTMSLFKNWPLMSSILLYCVFALHDMAYTELFSLWVVSPRTDGGLSYTSEGVGEVLAISGAGLLIFQMSLYSYGERILGPLMITRIAAILTIPLLQAYPFMTYLSGIPLFLILNTASLIKNILSISAITGTFLLQNRVVEQKQRGAANGLALTVMSACKAIGPAVGGAIFSWAQKRHHAAFLPGDHIVFFLLNVVEFVGVVMTFKPFIADFQK